MCLGVPAEVLEIDGYRAKVRVGGTRYAAGLHLVENVEVGDYILLHSGYAIGKIDKAQAEETLRAIAEAHQRAEEEKGQETGRSRSASGADGEGTGG